MAAVTHLLVVDYDESKETLVETYGATPEGIDKVIRQFLKEVEKEPDTRATFTQKTMELIQSGKITGGILLTLATERITELVQMYGVRSALREMLLRELQEDENEPPEDDGDN